MKTLAQVIPALMVGLCVSVLDVHAQPSQRSKVPPISARDQEEVRQGYEAAGSTPSVLLSGQFQTFKAGAHRFRIKPVSGWQLQEMDMGSAKRFCFSGPERVGKGAATFVVIVVPGADAPTPDVLMQGMLRPYRQRMANYSENPCSLQFSGGAKHSGVEFKGEIGGVVGVKGFFVIFPAKGALYAVSGSDRAEFYACSMNQFNSLAASLDIQS